MDWYFALCNLINTQILQNANIAIACSGGVDSVFLTHVISQFASHSNISVLIVDHKLQKSSTIVARQTASLIGTFGLNSYILTWHHVEIIAGIEEKARIARYALIQDFCLKNNIKSVFVAHHIDDKIETFFLNAMRACGLAGLSSMRGEISINGITYFRPMLYIVQKHQIIEYMVEKNISWLEDETNQHLGFARNRVRQMLQFTPTQKRNILTTIQNIELEHANKIEIVNTFINENVAFSNAIATIPMNKMNGLPPAYFRDFISIIIFNFIYKYSSWELRQAGVQALQAWLHEGTKPFTFAKCLFYKNKNNLCIMPEYRRLNSVAALPGQNNAWNGVLLCTVSKSCSIVAFGNIDAKIRKSINATEKFTNIAHIPVFYCEGSYEMARIEANFSITTSNMKISII